MIQPAFKMLGLFVIFFGLFTSVFAQQSKRGTGFNDNVPIVGFAGTSVFWGYNWGSSTSKDKSAEWPWMEYTPMLWGPDSGHTSTWNADAQYALSNLGSGHLLAFNEPDICTGNGCCISPQHACNAYRTWMQPFAGSAGLVSPAVSNAGLDWMSEFLSICTDVKIDYVSFHWYDQWNNLGYFNNYLSNIKAIADDRKIWLTEVSYTKYLRRVPIANSKCSSKVLEILTSSPTSLPMSFQFWIMIRRSIVILTLEWLLVLHPSF